VDFELTPDQMLLQDTLQRFLTREYDFERRRAVLANEHGFSEEAWRALAGQGLLGVGLPEAYGGFGGPVEVMIVMEQLGRALLLEPFLSTVVLGAGLVAGSAAGARQSDILERIAAGECRMALAHHEAGARYVLDFVHTTVREGDGGYVLDGVKTVVPDGAVANLLIVSARDDKAGGLSLFLVEPDAPRVECVRYRTQDGRSAADVSLRGTRIARDALLGERGRALPMLEQAIDRAIAALCAEAVGSIEALNDATLEHLRTRQQFGQPIGRFQVLQHRIVDMFVAATQARSMSCLATGRCTDPDPVRRRYAVSAAKAFIGKAARFVGQQAIQLHGGMGMSAELAVAHHFKRLTMIDVTFGDVDHHLGYISDRILAESA
jgi:alkylation response protein AidB-like acyl-CoA dehydrogenase